MDTSGFEKLRNSLANHDLVLFFQLDNSSLFWTSQPNVIITAETDLRDDEMDKKVIICRHLRDISCQNFPTSPINHTGCI